MKYKYRHQERYKDIKIDCVANTKKELLIKVQKKKDQIDKMVIDDSMRLADFITAYLNTYKANSVQRSWYDDLVRLGNKIVDGVGNKPIGKITPMEVQAFLNSLSGYSNSTIKKVYDLTVQLFRQASLNGATSYTFSLTKPKGKEAVAGRTMTDEEQQTFLTAIDGHRGELFLKLIYYCGLRPSEVSALTWADVDLDAEIITVSKAIKKDGSIGTPKSTAGYRKVPIPSTLLPLLQKSLKSKNKPVCEQTNGHYTKSATRKMWASAKKLIEAQLGHDTDIRLYDIRHTYCTNLERAGVPIGIASRLMGHSDISITAKIYTHENNTSLEIAKNLINREMVREQSPKPLKNAQSDTDS